ncbi:transcriptional regulator PpsR [Bradyrhizobium sp. SSBR45G]|uniref:transcriptional regulator PpsR n=1 Tax=unclassified Bradyrhizobium TaxID=2631580 RepID=UPI0023429A5C|nr:MULTISPECIES: transcriptional regulator PpsR [unclassified Bradyrhizobium]GLH81736.1 transcriptional regulator PpsR [Bradyrhizobium sp. SSBR45G]GLH89144.1 transcriptional regulator PpsR [Bradyrhizobium sp. SSBR45R]
MLVAAASDIALALDADGNIQDLAFQQAGLPLELRNTDEWIGRSWQATVSEESQTKPELLLAEASERKVSRWREVRYPAARGPDIPILFAVVAIKGPARFIAVGRDVRATAALQQKLIEAQVAIERDYSRMRNAESRYRILFQITAEPVLIIDAVSHRIVEANPAAADLLDHGAANLIGKLFPDALLLDDLSMSQSLSLAIRSQGKIERTRIRLDGGRDYLLDGTFFRQDMSALFLLRFSPQTSQAAIPKASDVNTQLVQFVEAAPDGFVITDMEGRLLHANPTFLQLAQIENMHQILGETIDRWIGKSAIDFSIMLTNLRQHGSVKLFSSVIRGEHGSPVDVEISATTVGAPGQSRLGFTIRNVSPRISGDGGDHGYIPRSREQLAELIGRVPLKELVRETTDVIERMCIETALKLTGDNRATAAEMLGLSRQSLYVKLRRYGLAEPAEDDSQLE